MRPPLLGRASAKSWHDLRGPVAHEPDLVVEVDAHPELTGAGVGGALKLGNTVSRCANRREPVGQVVDQAELLDQPAVGTARHDMIG